MLPNSCATLLFVTATLGALYLGFLLRRPVSLLCDSSKCPYCYGTELCEDVFNERITLTYDTFRDLFANLFSVKNVYFADRSGSRVVLKKLGTQSELDRVRPLHPLSRKRILEHVDSDSGARSLKTCDSRTTEAFVDRSLEAGFGLEQLWTVIQVNPEPLILTIFPKREGWPLPRLLGSCGFILVEQHCGHSLNHFHDFQWRKRALLALQLLQAALDFTDRHPDFRLYLTDISPDNVAVDEDFNLHLVDVENVVVKRRRSDDATVHYTRHFDDEEGFVYSEEEVCGGERSDHNIYGVCRLLLSRSAPWPMMQGGLLHSPPPEIVEKYKDLFTGIEECVDSKQGKDRFRLAEEMIELLKEIV